MPTPGTVGVSRQLLASSVVEFLDHLGVGRAVFVGASLGGITALTIAAQHPERVAGIGLVDIGHRLEDEGVARIVEFMTKHESFASLDEAAVAVSEYLPGRSSPSSPERLRRNLRQRPDGRWEWKHTYGRSLREAATTDPDRRPGEWRDLTAGMDDEFTRLQCPVLVMRGSRSDVLSDEGAREVAALIPNARLATIGAAGHHAAGDNPETTVSLVREFLTEIDW